MIKIAVSRYFRDLSPTTFSGETVNKSQQIATITLAAAKNGAGRRG
jgi:hypothetical protein